MDAGTYISGIGHAGLIVWALIGGLFAPARDVTVEVTEVSLITREEYAALLAPTPGPEAEVEIPTPVAPEVEQVTPPAPVADTPPETQEPPVAEAPAPADETPKTPELIQPPVAEVEDTPPDTPQPPAEDTAVVIAPPDEVATPLEAPRVAAVPVAPSEPDTQVDEVVREEATPDPEAEVVREEDDATAPEETTTEIVTEAEEPASAAPTASARPSARPVRTAEPEAEQPSDAIEDALQIALAEPEITAPQLAPAGPPLSFGEKDALRVAVSNCWVVDVGGVSSSVTVVVGVTLDREGKVVGDSIHLISSEGGNDTVVAVAFQKARSAIHRCQKGGYDLPSEKYSHWREIEMTFNPEKMRLK